MTEHASSDDAAAFRLDLQPGATKLYVFFGGIAGGIGMPVFEFAGAAGILDDHRLFVRDLRQSWYHRGLDGSARSIDGFADALRAQMQMACTEDVVFVGNSMGGYAALTLGAMLRVPRVIAFAPQTIISPEGRRQLGDERWAGQMRALHAELAEHPTFDLPSWLAREAPDLHASVHVSEGDELDAKHASALEGLANVRVRRYRIGGHALVRQLRDQGRLPAILRGETA